MSTPNPLDERVAELGKASRRAAVAGLLGFLLVLVAIGYAVGQLSHLERQRESLLADQKVLVKKQNDLVADTERVRGELARVQADLAKSRASLAAARAAINAFHAGRLEDAVALYDEALAADPGNAYLQNLRAYSLFRLGRIDAAIQGQRLSLAADPNYAWGYFDLARFLYAASPPRVEEAQKAEARAIELRPDMRTIMNGDGQFQTLRRRRQPQ